MAIQEILQRSWEPRRWEVQWLAIRNWQWPVESNLWSWFSYNYTRSCQRTQHQPFYGHSAFEANWKGEKAWQVSASWADCKSKKSSFLKASYLILCSNNEPFLDRVVTCDKKWILYHSWRRPAQWLDREESPKCFPKPNLHQKKSWSLFRGLLPVWSTIAFWIPAKPLIWDVCSANQWDALKTATPLASTGQ